MNNYLVTAAFRTNFNNAGTHRTEIRVSAVNRECALFQAGFALLRELNLQREGIVPESLSLSVRRLGRVP